MEVINKARANNEKRVEFMLSVAITNVSSERCVVDKECEGGRGWPRRESNTENERWEDRTRKRAPRLKGSTYKHSKKMTAICKKPNKRSVLRGQVEAHNELPLITVD